MLQWFKNLFGKAKAEAVVIEQKAHIVEAETQASLERAIQALDAEVVALQAKKAEVHARLDQILTKGK